MPTGNNTILKNRAARRAEETISEAEKQRRVELVKKGVQLLRKGIHDPEQWFRTMSRIHVLRCIGIIIDNTLSDIDEYIPFITFDKKTQCLFKHTQKDLNALLIQLRRASIDYFGQDCLDKHQNKDEEYSDLYNCANALGTIMEDIVGYCLERKDNWRCVEIAKTFSRIIPDTARQEAYRKTQEHLNRHLSKALLDIAGTYLEPIVMQDATAETGDNNSDTTTTTNNQ